MPISNNVRARMASGSWIREMFEEGSLLKKRYGEDGVFDLSLGNPITEPPTEFKLEIKKLADNPFPGMHRYMANAGYTDTRAIIASQLALETSIKFTLDDIIMTCGAAGALNVILKTILNPMDEVIVFAPYFMEYGNYIDNHGGIIKVITTNEQFMPKLEELNKSITPKTKAIIINSPNNPTGVIYNGSFIRQLAMIIHQKEIQFGTEIFIISDEAYRKLIYDDLKHFSVLPHHARSFIATSFSKDLSIPGERIGYIAVHPEINNKEEFINGFIFCNRILGFVNAPALMQHLVSKLQHVTISIEDYQKKRDFLYNNLVELGYQVVKPQGAFYMFPKSPIEDDISFVKELQRHNVLVVPGRGFGTPGFYRISYCVSNITLEGSLSGFREAAQKYNLY